MSAFPYVISKEALADLDAIWLYTAEKWSLTQADRYYFMIIDEIDFISRNVQSGKSMEYLRKGYRASKVKSHLIFYRISTDGIEIIRILHERMDLQTKLGE
jgi:toxin ParE1/3/4